MTLSFAAIGAGWVTANRHIPALLRQRGVRLAAVIDHRPERAATLARKLGVAAATSFDDPALEGVQAVTIGTPPPSHCALVLEALARGWHVLVEKPFAMSPAQAREMIDAAARARRVLGVVHNFQFARSVSEARRRIEAGELGELRSVTGVQLSSPARRLPSWYRDLPCGLFYDEAPHLQYLLRSFLGNAAGHLRAHVIPSLDPADHTPRAVTTIHDSGAVLGYTHTLFESALSEWHLALVGTRGTLVADVFRDILVELPPDHRHESRDVLRTTWAGTSTHLLGTLRSGWRHARGTLDYGNNEVLRRFVAAVRTGEPPEGIAATDGAAVVDMLAAVVNSAKRPAAITG
jgi:predicted dehydrogenase